MIEEDNPTLTFDLRTHGLNRHHCAHWQGTLCLGLTGVHINPRLQALEILAHAGDRQKDVWFWGVCGTWCLWSGALKRMARDVPRCPLCPALAQAEQCLLGRKEGEWKQPHCLWPPSSISVPLHWWGPPLSRCLPLLRERLSESLGLLPFITHPRATVRSQLPAPTCHSELVCTLLSSSEHPSTRDPAGPAQVEAWGTGFRKDRVRQQHLTPGSFIGNTEFPPFLESWTHRVVGGPLRNSSALTGLAQFPPGQHPILPPSFRVRGSCGRRDYLYLLTPWVPA